MADYGALQARVRELAERDWTCRPSRPGTESWLRRDPQKDPEPGRDSGNKQLILDRVQRRGEYTTCWLAIAPGAPRWP
jgi:hypothetical protein